MGSSSKEEQSRVRSLLLDTVSLLCKNGLTFKKQMKIQGLLGITLDEDVFIVHINEAVGDAAEEPAKRTGERSSSRESSSTAKTPDKSARKRGATSSPASRGPPDKRQAGGDVIVILEDDKSKNEKKPLITNVRGGLPLNHPLTPQKNAGVRGPVMGSPNRMPFVRVIGSPNQATPMQPTPVPAHPTSTPYFGVAPLIAGINGQRLRRPNIPAQKSYHCQVENCNNGYFSMAALKLHIKRKHSDIEPEQLQKLQSESFKRKLVFTDQRCLNKPEQNIVCNSTAEFQTSSGSDAIDFENEFQPLKFEESKEAVTTSLTSKHEDKSTVTATESDIDSIDRCSDESYNVQNAETACSIERDADETLAMRHSGPML